MAFVSIFTTLCNTALSVLGVLFPAHMKDFVHNLKATTFNSTIVYTDKNVEMDGVKTTSVITPDVMKKVTEYQGYDESFKASQDAVVSPKDLTPTVDIAQDVDVDINIKQESTATLIQDAPEN